MPQVLGPIPLGVEIVDKDGAINEFFRLRWQEIETSFEQVPTAARINDSGLTAALATTTVFTTVAAGVYEIDYYIRKTVAGGVSSSLTVTIGWTENGVEYHDRDRVCVKCRRDDDVSV
jgi:hypothetical protein